MSNILALLYVAVVGVLSIYGLLGFLTLALFWRHREGDNAVPDIKWNSLPSVTVQLPIFNERLVVERLIDAAVKLNYPRDRLQIQVIDDSDDETVQVAASRVAHYRSLGFDIVHIRRAHRRGYKAGALAAALEQANGEYLAIFDADFLPDREFLLDTIPHFVDYPRLGMIQARWGHLNASQSVLTAAQSIALDKHFVMEQHVRHRTNMFPKFNGSAGIWRRVCVDDSGGWQSDTVCEDLCLSTRATLRGWDFRYLGEVVAPAELPASIRAYKNQQARWAKGSIQCLRKYGVNILSDAQHTLLGRLYAVLSMSAYSTHLLLLLLLLLQVPMLLMNIKLPSAMLLFTLIGIGQPLLFITAQRVTYPDWGRRLLYFPLLLLVAIGTAPSNARAMLEALFYRGHHVFVRTPKGPTSQASAADNQQSYKLPGDGTLWFEVALALYAAVGLALAAYRGQFGPVFILLTCFTGFAYVAFLEIREIYTS